MNIRADESKIKRQGDSEKLEAFLKENYTPGNFIPILQWYELMKELGLGQSARQRLSQLRDEKGLQMDYNRTKKGYFYMGFQEAGQLALFQSAA